MAAAAFSFVILAVIAVKTDINKKFIIMLLVICGACLAFTVKDRFFGSSESIEFVSKNPAGSAEKDVGLKAVIEGEEPLDMKMKIPSVQYTEEEAERIFERTVNEIDASVPGEGNSLERTVRDISLPSSFPDNPVAIEWQSSNPVVLSSAGKIGTVKEEGEEVTLTAVMTLGGLEDRYYLPLTVFPKEESSGPADLLKNAAEEMNQDETDERYYLPSELNGKRVEWYENAADKAGTLSVIVLIAAVFVIIRERKKDENDEKKRNEELRRAYPELVSRILLLSYAGLSIRKIMYRIGSEYRSGRQKGVINENEEMLKEIARVCSDMDNGTGEQEAYENLGSRCSEAGYRSLAVLLSRSTSRGAAGMLPTLEQEASSAFEDAKRRAKAAGDLAAVKLLLPMALMLVVVMVIVLVPSFLSFAGG